MKTRTQATGGGALAAARTLLAQDGPLGFYRGFSVSLLGSLPTRLLYLGVLEASKSRLRDVLQEPAFAAIPPALRTGAADFLAGAAASVCSQAVVIPIDVVSQRLMVQGGASAGIGAGGSAVPVVYKSGLAVARGIIATEGVRGLYRGSGVSLLLYVPSSGLWWGCYGGYQRLLWDARARARGDGEADGSPSQGEVVGVQAGSALLAGATSGLLTTPLDVVKTQLQTAPLGGRVTLRQAVAGLLAADGVRGLFRGVGPRVLSACAWGTCMSSALELLKRHSVRAPPE